MMEQPWLMDFRQPYSAAAGSVLVLGTFDGVHLGHQALMQQGRRLSKELACPLTVMTFHPHPMKVLFPEKAPPLLTTLMERAEYLTKYGADRLVVMRFNRQMAAESPKMFLHRLEEMRPMAVVVGYNFTFGRQAAGDASTLEKWGMMHGVQVKMVPRVTMRGEGISSTRIRQLILEGNVEGATKLLGHTYVLSGYVERGKGIGRTMGFPTANISIDPERVLPAFGVYLCTLSMQGSTYPAVVNVGHHPTLPEGAVTVEAHLPGVHLDLYSQRVRLILMRYLRAEIKFDSMEALQAQIGQDVAKAEQFFARIGIRGEQNQESTSADESASADQAEEV